MFKFSQNQTAIIIVLIITGIFLFPAFLGKIDTPTDIRDVRMYPWRYHEVDKKIEKTDLWKGSLSQEKKIQELKTLPGSTNTITFNLNNAILRDVGKRSDKNYYVSFDFKPGSDKTVPFDLGILLINESKNITFAPGVAIVPMSKNNESEVWYKAYYPINDLIKALKELKDLNSYELKIIIKNKDINRASSLFLKDLKLACEDFSCAKKVHNHYNNDLIQMFAPIREYFSLNIKKFKLPFWNNYILTGAEFLAEPQVGFFHPVYFLFYFLFDYFTAHELLVFFALALCGIGAYLLSRFWGLSFGASLLTALVYMFHPFNVTWFSYEHMIMNSAVMPFLFLAYEKNLTHQKILNKYLLISAALLGLIFISGHLQYIYYSAVFFIMFALFRFLMDLFLKKKLFFKHFFSFIFVLLIGIMIGSIVLVPFFTLLNGSHRSYNPDSLVKATSVPLRAFLGLFSPFYKGYPDWPLSGIQNQSLDYTNFRAGFARNYVYFGLLPFIFSIFSLKLVFKNKLILFFIFSIIFSLLICTGSPLFYCLREFLIGFKQMQHYRFLQIYSYCVPFLVGFGFQFLTNHFSFLKEKTKKILFLTVFLISVIDLMYYSSYFVTWSDRSSYKPVHKGGALEFLINEQKKSKEPFRVLPFVSQKVEATSLKPDIAEPNTLLPYNLEDVSGYSSFIPKDIYYTLFFIQTMDSKKLYTGEIFDLFSNINTPYPISNYHSKILDLLNVKYFLVPNFLILESSKVKKVFSGDSNVYENKNCFPRAFVVDDYKVIKSSEETISELDSENFDPRKEVILMSLSDVSMVTKQSDNVVRLPRRGFASPRNDIVSSLKYETNKITLKASVNKPSILVLSNNLNTNWKVKINGKEEKHFPANLVQRGVYLPGAGDYLVEFYYFSKRFLIGLSVTSFALLILFVLYIWSIAISFTNNHH